MISKILTGGTGKSKVTITFLGLKGFIKVRHVKVFFYNTNQLQVNDI
jgi:hypothetical protein